jgi:hypothetical protein
MYATKKYFSFSKAEKNAFLLTALAFGFIFSFKSWGVEQFDLLFGIRNLILATVLSSIVLLVKLSAQKYFAIKIGFAAEYRMWPIGLIVGLFLVFLTNGNFVFLGIGSLVFHTISTMRIGHEGQVSYGSIGWLSVLGPIANVFLATVFKILAGIPALTEIMTFAMKISLLTAAYAILPIPIFKIPKTTLAVQKWWENLDASDGLNLLYASRWAYVAALIFVLASAGALIALPLILAIISVLVLTGLGWILYYLLVEHSL